MYRNRSVNAHQFAMVPRADIPRSAFRRQSTLKTTIDAGFLYPIFIDEVLPGDTFRLNATIFGRLSTPLVPVMDNLVMETFFFFVPNRLVWTNWVNFMGEQDNPGDSISYVIPKITSPTAGYVPLSIFDYFGLPTVGQVNSTGTVTHSVLPLRAYNLIWNTWFRDENLQNSVTINKHAGPDPITDYTLLRRGKRRDYFTACLPWPQKGSPVSLPLGLSAPVKTTGVGPTGINSTAGRFGNLYETGGGSNSTWVIVGPAQAGRDTGMYADLSQTTAATINQIRQSFQVQKLLERDARGGTRYTELLQSHFGVRSPDARLQRPEYLGGGSTPISINPIAQTSGTGATGQTTPLGQLSAMGTLIAKRNGFSSSFVEHGYVIGIASVRADLTYQQGLRKLWSRNTRFDFYFPVFAMLGEQAVLNREIWCRGNLSDDNVFGYQERWAEYRYFPSLITGLMRSTTAGTLDIWHLAQNFTTLPTLNSTFIEDRPPVHRVVAAGAGANGQQFLLDVFFDINTVRPMPMYSVPGLIDHF